MSLLDLKDKIENIAIEVEGKTAILTMNRPKALNALNHDTLAEIQTVMAEIAADESIWGVIITGAGRSFVAGADVSEFVNFDALSARALSEHGQKAMDAIENLAKPVIAAVNGFALGGGNELSMACDIRIASTKAKFGQPEVNLGVMPFFGGTQRLTRLCGYGAAKRLIFSAEMIDAEEALRIGLVDKVVEPEVLLDEAKAMMNLILTKTPRAVRYAKVAINKGAGMSLADGLEFEKTINAILFASQDKVEGVDAFLNKRTPEYKNI
ncbi:MAG: enoyl-CoA hydratase/isomerase family protein [Firmicutes bacterium]|nr:enoyl-CoA hydratase/isomerase family protein [Bacillota bacterium]